jgi:hypothetical protein
VLAPHPPIRSKPFIAPPLMAVVCAALLCDTLGTTSLARLSGMVLPSWRLPLVAPSQRRSSTPR